MTMRLPTKTVMIVLITSVSATSMLSACTYTKRKLDYYTNDREPQVVDGPRRVPMLNPRMAPKAPLAPNRAQQTAPATAQQTAPTPASENSLGLPSFMTEESQPAQAAAEDRVPTYEESPYDYYDTKGNRVEPEQAKKGPNQVEQFFDRLFSGESKVEELRKSPRKTFMENDYPAEERMMEAPTLQPMSDGPSAPAAPSPSPWSVEHVEPAMPVHESQHVEAEHFSVHDDDVRQVTSFEEPVQNVEPMAKHSAVEVAEQDAKPTWLERFASDVGDAFSTNDAHAAEPNQEWAGEQDTYQQEAPEAAPIVMAMVSEEEHEEFPKLTSVPETPESFESVRENRDDKIRDLQQELLQAHQDRKDLYSEPSSQDALVPVDLDKAPPVVMHDDGTTLLGHVSDEDAPVSGKVGGADLPVQAPAEMEMAAVETAEKEAWWEEWNLFSSKQQNEQMVQAAASPAKEVTQQYAEHDGTFPWHDDSDFPANKPAGVGMEDVAVEQVIPEQLAPVVAEGDQPAMIRIDPELKPVPALVREETETFEVLAEESAPVVTELKDEPPMVLAEESLQPETAMEESAEPFFAEETQAAAPAVEEATENLVFSPAPMETEEPAEILAEQNEQLATPVAMAEEPVVETLSSPAEPVVQPLVEEVSPAAGSTLPELTEGTPSVAVPAPTQARSDADMQEEYEQTRELLSEDDAAGEALPSTELLRRVKTLPPSRYSGRNLR